ncbi:hypothetical protein [Bacillus phage phiAGATE]|uniref:Uncharacterized protein n=1 Tax=Bacillus phage phiAGATE TaxID=1204533 RepID=L0L990_9CAUD|nr:hypothetical protein G380_gp068 [Bacillus phage phiAGATE]AGB62718.1 hypothetical protein [Bacillus phage phiAGATE]
MSKGHVPPPFEEFTKEEAKAFATTNVSAEDVASEAAIVRMYSEGHTVGEIQDTFKISSGKMYEIITRHSLPLRNGRIKNSKAGKRLQEMTKKDKRNLVTDYENGMNLNDIYKKYNINKHGTYTILNEFKVDRKVATRKVADRGSKSATLDNSRNIMLVDKNKTPSVSDWTRPPSADIVVSDPSRVRKVSIPLENITDIQMGVDDVGNPTVKFTVLKGTNVTL